VFFGHPKTVAHGLTLTRGTSIIWPGPTYDLTWFKQLNGRQARIGQKEKTEIIVMLAKGTLEEDIYNNILMAKAGRMTNLLDLFGSMTTQDLAVV
jgi:SNF2 family DNA or RNA helicase